MPLPRVFLVVPDPLGANRTIVAEVARTPAEIERGFADRDPLPTTEQPGMLFDLGSPGFRPFWMKGMRFPLDMLFLDADGVIVAIQGNLRPFDEALRSATTPYAWVLEAPGGWARRRGVRVGQRVVAMIPPLPLIFPLAALRGLG